MIRSTLAPFCSLGSLLSGAQAPALDWQHGYGGGQQERFIGGTLTDDGGYVFTGESMGIGGDVTMNHGFLDVWVVKLDAQGELAWQTSLGGTSMEQGHKILQTTDGGYFVLAFSGSADGDVIGQHGQADAWVFKLTANGSLDWQRMLGGSLEDDMWGLEQTPDGGYVLAGFCGSSEDGDVQGSHGSADAWLLKLDAEGTLEWQKPFGGSALDGFSNVRQLVDGGFICVGHTWSSDGDVTTNHGGGDAWVVRTDASGELLWELAVGGSDGEGASDVEVTPDGEFMIGGSTSSVDGDAATDPAVGQDAWLFKLDAAGALMWQTTYGSSGYDASWAMRRTAAEDYLMTCFVGADDGDVIGYHGGNRDAWMIKVDAAGQLIWQRPTGGSSSDDLYSLSLTFDGGCIMGGMTYSQDGDAIDAEVGGAWVVKLDPDGNVMVADDRRQCAAMRWSPWSNDLLVSSTGQDSGGKVVVHDASGRVLIEQRMDRQTNKVDCSMLPAGLYVAGLRDTEATGPLVFVKD